MSRYRAFEHIDFSNHQTKYLIPPPPLLPSLYKLKETSSLIPLPFIRWLSFPS